jgi:hypothetical protein
MTSMAGGGVAPHRQLARAPHGAHFPCKRERTLEQVAFNDAIHNSRVQRLARRKRLAQRAHLGRQRHPGQARQSYRARRAGYQPQLHFRLAHLRIRRDHAVVTRHGQLESRPQRLPVDRHDDRLSAVFNLIQPAVKLRPRPAPALVFDEFLNIGARREAPPRSAHDDGLHGRIRAGRLHRFRDSLRRSGGQRIHRRMVEGDYGHGAVALLLNAKTLQSSILRARRPHSAT